MREMDIRSDEEYQAAIDAVVGVRAAKLVDLLGEDLTVYFPMQNTDLTEGRGGAARRGCFLDKALATKANAMLMGVQGAPNRSKLSQERIYLTLDEWERDYAKHLRKL